MILGALALFTSAVAFAFAVGTGLVMAITTYNNDDSVNGYILASRMNGLAWPVAWLAWIVFRWLDGAVNEAREK